MTHRYIPGFIAEAVVGSKLPATNDVAEGQGDRGGPFKLRVWCVLNSVHGVGEHGDSDDNEIRTGKWFEVGSSDGQAVERQGNNMNMIDPENVEIRRWDLFGIPKLICDSSSCAIIPSPFFQWYGYLIKHIQLSYIYSPIQGSYKTQGTELALRRIAAHPWMDDIRVSDAHFEAKWTRRGGYAPIHYSSTAGDRSRTPSDPGQLMPSPKKDGSWTGMEELGLLSAPIPQYSLNDVREDAAPHSGSGQSYCRHFVLDLAPPRFYLRNPCMFLWSVQPQGAVFGKVLEQYTETRVGYWTFRRDKYPNGNERTAVAKSIH
ncbi:hypothetical protein B0H34DRAFT_679337 [Crassisporium funariophilum]|nr:hypothetical protein B0H34DRAFT_679337 [Crassisporium funariophilum]